MSELIFSVRSALRTLFLDLCSIVYKLIVVCYNVFERIGTANILQGSDIFQQIANRIGLILGLFMVFRITFLFIQYIINPDDMTDKSKGIGNIVKRVLISVVLLGSVSGMFNLAFKFQNLLIEDNVIPNIIFNESEYDTENFGSRLSSMLFFSFFRYEEDEENEMSNVEMNRAAQDCIALEEAMKIDVENNNNYELVFSCVDAKVEYTNHATGETEEKFVYTFDGGGLLALAVGLFTLYSIFIFTIQVGVRLIQLAYLQLISPVPIMMYIAPKGEEKLKNWGSQCLTTFLDYFLRSAIIYFVVFLINILMNSRDSGIDEIWTGNTGTDAYILIILIIALFTFARKVPNLLKEIFPSLGGAASFDYGLRMSNEAQRTLRAAGGAVIGAGIGITGGRAIRGALQGIAGGVRNQHLNQIAGDTANRNRRRREIRNGESTLDGRIESRLRNTFGFESQTAQIDRQIEEINNGELMENHGRNERIIGAEKAMMERAKSQLLKEDATGADAERLRKQQQYVESLRKTAQETGLRADIDAFVAEQTKFENDLKSSAEAWITAKASTDTEIARNMQLIENETGRRITNYTDVEREAKSAKTSETTNARAIAALEQRKTELEHQKRQAQANESAVNRGGGGH